MRLRLDEEGVKGVRVGGSECVDSVVGRGLRATRGEIWTWLGPVR
jgi:hypothetical protein